MMKLKFSSIALILSLSVVNILTHSEYQKDVDEMVLIKKRGKIAACMSALRNFLAEGNEEFRETLNKSNFDKTKSYEKLVLNILNNCVSNISDSEIEQLLSPDNILHFNSQYLSLLKIDKNILTGKELVLTEQENFILNEINESSQTLDTDLSMQEDEIGIGGVKISQFGKYQYIFVIIAISLTFIIVVGGLYLLVKKPPKKVKKRNREIKY